MLDRIRLSHKLAAMVVIPMVAILVFAAMDLSRRARLSSEMRRLERLTRTAMQADRVAGTLHAERSLTAGLATSEEAGSDELELQRERTDAAVDAFREHVAAESVDEELQVLLDEALAALERLPQHRLAIASGELSAAAAVSAYNDMTGALRPIIAHASRRASHTEVRSLLQAVDVLVQLRDSADLERAALNVAFTSGAISRGLAQAVAEMAARQDALQSVLESQAPPEVVALVETAVDGAVTESVTTMRFEALDAADEGILEGSPATWWRVSSSRIDALADVEAEVADRILARVESLADASARAVVLGIVLVLLAVGGGVVLSALVGRSVNSSLTRASDTIREAVAQISASIQQLSASTGETAAAVSQTSTTVEELRQTSDAAARKAEATSASADDSRGASQRANDTARRGMEAMRSIRTEVEGIAQRIIELSERNAQISEIIENVNAIAEQSNLLAVNASIEAAKAGEHGRGFAVVASEVKTLAERSKEATQQIRAILTEIQRSSNAAVMVTEQGVKRVDEGHGTIEELARAIESLAVTIDESSEAAEQISLISRQQLAGIEQITESLHSVEQAASDNASGAGQLEKAAGRLAEVSAWIIRIVKGGAAGGDGR